MRITVNYEYGDSIDVPYNETFMIDFSFNVIEKVEEMPVLEIEIKVNGIPDTDKESLQMVDTKDSVRIKGYIMLVGISLASISIIKYRRKES